MDLSELFGEDGDETSSIASTLEEEHDSQDEWEVNGVLAEAKIDGEVKYLIEWKGYPLWDAGWEPQEHLTGDGLLQDWEERKKRKDHVMCSRRSIGAWRKAVSQRLHDKAARHEERNRKRTERGLPPTTHAKSLEELLADLDAYPSGDEDAETAHDTTALFANAFVSSPAEDSGAQADDESPFVPPTQHNTGLPDIDHLTTKVHQHELDDPFPEESKAESSQSKTGSKTPRSQSADALKSKTGSKIGSMPDTSLRKSSTKSSTANQTSPVSIKRSSFEGKQKQPKSTKPTVDISNVFIGGKVRKQRRTLSDAAADPATKPQFLNAHKRRLLEIRSRDRDVVVAPRLPTKLFCLGANNGQSLLPKKPSDLSTAPKIPLPATILKPAVQKSATEGQGSPVKDGIQGLPDKPPPPAIKPKKKKSVRFDDTLIVQEPVVSSPEGGLFCEDMDLEPDTPAKEELGMGHALHVENSSSQSKQGQPRWRSISKNFSFGQHPGQRIPVTFIGIPSETDTSWVVELDVFDTLEFTHTCSAKDFQAQNDKGALKTNQLCEGSLKSSDAHGQFETMVERLRLTGLGIFCYYESFCILIYPRRCEEWQAVHNLHVTASDPPLGYDIFEPHPSLGRQFLAPIPLTGNPDDQDTTLTMRPRIFHQFFGFNYNQLVPSKLQDTARHHFFLAFPRSVSREAALLYQWLRSCNPDCIISGSNFPGQWLNFIKLEKGIVIVHEDSINAIRLFPAFANILQLHSDQFSFWMFTKALHSLPLFNSPKHSADENGYPGDIRLQRILPPGMVILVTPSFFVAHPEQAWTFIKWFWNMYYKKSRCVRLAVCADFEDWVYRLALEMAQKRRSALNNAALNGQINETIEAVEGRFKAWSLIHIMMEDEKEDSQGFLVCAPSGIDGNDEQSLVNWFGCWSMMNLDQARRFIVLGSGNQYHRLSRRIRIPQFSVGVLDEPDSACVAPGQEERTQGINDGLNMAEEDQTRNFKIVPNDDARSLITFLTSLVYMIPSSRWCPILLYKFPISYWSREMVAHFGEHPPAFATFDACFEFFRPLGFNHSVINTQTAFCYTIDGTWDPSAYPKDKIPHRRPWVIMYRPVNVFMKPWKASEVLIWDICADPKIARNKTAYESDLIPAQRAAIRVVRDSNEVKNPKMPLQKVWIGGFNPPRTKYTHPLDITLDYMRLLVEELKHLVPASEDRLPDKGWVLVKPGDGPGTETRDSSESMDIDSSSGETDDELQETHEMRILFHPPCGNNRGPGSRCKNRLFQHASEAKKGSSRSSEMDYTFLPTAEWYEEQHAKGRGFEHIKVMDWDTFIKRVDITDHRT